MKRNQLENFKKQDKRNKIIIGSVIGILLIIGSFIIYKTYAFYEEKKSFNVLKGRIPDFGYDIKMLSVVIDDKKSESIPERGMYKTNVHCTNGTFGEWDYNNWNLTLNNVSSESKCNVTFTSGLSEEDYNKYIEAGKALHRNTYRGKDITSYYSDGSLYTRISNGSFEDIYVGDYIKTTFKAKDYIWLIADLDNYLYTGTDNGNLWSYHVTIIPAIPLMSTGMNVYGSLVWSSSGYDAGLDHQQYAIFALKPELINSYDRKRMAYWLRNVFGASKSAYVGFQGLPDGTYEHASHSFGVRPRFPYRLKFFLEFIKKYVIIKLIEP